MKITVNLATRPYTDQGPMLKRLRIGMAAMVLVLLLLWLGLTHFHQRALAMAAQEGAIDQSIAQIGREEQGYQAQMQQPANAKVLKQSQFLNHLFDEKSFSWTACMEDLERVLPAGVQVTAIEPVRGKDGRLTLQLRVSGQRERSVEMVRNMEHSRRFVTPRISNENAETGAQGDLQQVKDSGRVSFEIRAEYIQATLEERQAAIADQKKGHTGGSKAGGKQPVRKLAALPPARPLTAAPAAGQMGMRPNMPQNAPLMPPNVSAAMAAQMRARGMMNRNRPPGQADPSQIQPNQATPNGNDGSPQ